MNKVFSFKKTLIFGKAFEETGWHDGLELSNRAWSWFYLILYIAKQ